MHKKNKKFEFDPSVYKTRKTLEEYSVYNYNFMFKINKLSARVKRYTVRNFRKYNIGNPELVILSLIGQVKDQLTIKDLTTVHWMDKGFISRASKTLCEWFSKAEKYGPLNFDENFKCIMPDENGNSTEVLFSEIQSLLNNSFNPVHPGSLAHLDPPPLIFQF